MDEVEAPSGYSPRPPPIAEPAPGDDNNIVSVVVTDLLQFLATLVFLRVSMRPCHLSWEALWSRKKHGVTLPERAKTSSLGLATSVQSASTSTPSCAGAKAWDRAHAKTPVATASLLRKRPTRLMFCSAVVAVRTDRFNEEDPRHQAPSVSGRRLHPQAAHAIYIHVIVRSGLRIAMTSCWGCRISC